LEALPDDPERLLPASPPADEATDSLSDEVQGALRRLPEDFRAAVVLCDVVGLSYEDIASALDVPVGTVRSRIHRGRRMLRKALA
jgi:RNA polymerase sigma-70 factor (ECF subfamily)